jgi:6-phosphogluconolactonase
MLLAGSCGESEPTPGNTSQAGGAAGGGGSGANAGNAGTAGQGGAGGGGNGGSSGAQGGSASGSAGQGGGAGRGGNAGAGANAGNGGSGGSAGSGGAGKDGGASDATSDAASDRADSSTPPGVTYVYASGYDPKITIFTLDLASGTLTAKGSQDTGVPSPSYLAFSRDKRFLYAANEASGANSKVLAYKIASADGTLQKINEAATGGDGAPHLAVTPDGKWVLVAHYTSGHVSTLAVDGSGGVIAPPADVQRPANSTSHQVVIDSTGANVFVPNVNANTVFQFKLDAAGGKLTANGQVSGYPASAGPRHLALHPTKNWAYTMNETAVTVTSLVYDPGAGTLSSPQTIDSLPAGTAKTGTGAHVLVHPSGQFVYTSNRGHNSISIFEIDADAGRLTMRGNETGSGAIKTPRDFTVDPSGKFLLVANQDAASLMVFEINPADGKLTLRDTKTTPASPSFVGVVVLP